MIPSLPRAAATQLLIIRTALLFGLLLFGAATWYTQRSREVALAPDRIELFGYVFIGLASAALAGLFVLRSRLARAADPKQLMSMYIIGYALAEGAAMFGAVIWYMGGSRDWYVAGLVLMVVAFQVLPIKRGN